MTKPTLASQSMVGMTTSILPKEGKTNEYRSGTYRTSIHNIDTSKSTYLYDHQIMILSANTCHKNEYKSSDNHNTNIIYTDS